ncbi:uncharacterized protein [Nicotiana sylvestris]|uniref:uncharacterized protein n=1 Tax=Nicotiana sylvestris TaxID=4096 RepID=UPI00388C79BF
MMKRLTFNMHLVEALEQMPGYTKFMKDLVTKKRSMECETIKMTHQVSAIVHSMATKLKDPGAFNIPCTFGSADFAKALCDLGASINLMTYSVFKTLGIGQPRPTSMRLQMADRSMKLPLVLIILGRPFLATEKALVNVEVAVIVDDTSSMIHVEDPFEVVLLNMDVNDDASRVECVNSLHGMGSCSYEPRKLSLDLENRKIPSTKPSIEEPPLLELKSLPPHLRKKLKRDSLDFYWDEPYLFKICMDGVIRKCVPKEEQLSILEACHSSLFGGHNGGVRTASKVLSFGFYWPTLFKYVGGISKRDEMPLNTILEVDIFDVWGIDLMGPFVSSCGNTYILVAVVMSQSGLKP